MNEQLKHIFDDSTCLTRRQMKDYVSGIMGAEECHAAEHHINCCPFCSEAIDGMSVNPAEAVLAVNELDTTFLKEHFHRHTPQVHLNSLAPAAQSSDYGHVKTKAQKNKAKASLRNTSIAVIVLLALMLVWYLAFEKNKNGQHILPQQTSQSTLKTVTAATY